MVTLFKNKEKSYDKDKAIILGCAVLYAGYLGIRTKERTYFG